MFARCAIALLASVWLWCGFGGFAAEPAPSLDELLKEYRALGLPLPPKEAKLVRYEAGGGGIVNGRVQPTTFSVAFELNPASKTEGPLLLRATLEYRPSWDAHPQELKPE